MVKDIPEEMSDRTAETPGDGSKAPGGLVRFVKYTLYSLSGTLVNNLVLWFLSDVLLKGTYVGENIISPLISFECGVAVTFTVSYFFVWKDKVTQRSPKSYFKHFLPFNLSYTAVFFINLGLLNLILNLTGWDVVWCNLISMTLAGLVNFAVNNFIIFRKRGNAGGA